MRDLWHRRGPTNVSWFLLLKISSASTKSDLIWSLCDERMDVNIQNQPWGRSSCWGISSLLVEKVAILFTVSYCYVQNVKWMDLWGNTFAIYVFDVCCYIYWQVLSLELSTMTVYKCFSFLRHNVIHLHHTMDVFALWAHRRNNYTSCFGLPDSCEECEYERAKGKKVCLCPKRK